MRLLLVLILLGGTSFALVSAFLRQALAIATIGAALGGLLAIVAGFVIQAEIFGVSGVDVASLGGSTPLLTAAILLASILPAWRATRLDPNVVLRQEWDVSRIRPTWLSRLARSPIRPR